MPGGRGARRGRRVNLATTTTDSIDRTLNQTTQNATTADVLPNIIDLSS